MAPQASTELPNPFRFNDGREVRSPADWPARRAEIREAIVGIEYGGLPPAPPEVRGELLHATTVARFGGARFQSYRVHCGAERPFGFLMTVLAPPGEGRFPVVLTGDACWRYVSDAISAEVLGRGAVLAQFNRVELAPDIYSMDRVSGLYPVYPDHPFGALAAWAWGYHRCVDVLAGLEFVDPARIAVVGHSRGGKTALLAGATDERIALTAANDSGAGGAGCYRFQGPKSETLADNMRTLAYWYSPRLNDYVGREQDLPFDQHDLKALAAPRALLTCEALGDLWANPAGTWLTHLAAREVYRFLGVPDKIGIWFRPGEHSHSPADWRAFLDFMDWQLNGRPRPAAGYDVSPFDDLPQAFSWRAPVV